MKKLFDFRCWFLLLLTVSSFASETKITWHGHSAFEIVTPKGKVLFIDPWLDNPANPARSTKNEGKSPVTKIEKADFIFVTHGHSDHVGNSVELAKKTGARLVTNFELGQNMQEVLGFPKKQAGIDTLINVGGEIELANGEVLAVMTPAVHSSGLEDPVSHRHIYGGNPSGFIIRIKDGPTLYHTGDTAYFQDMTLIGDYAPDLALINIGGHFGMTPEMAAKAALAVKAKYTIPHHYRTFPILTQTAKPFIDALSAFSKAPSKSPVKVLVLEPGASVVFEGKELKK
jgi:L-ascorbate metabolism protein UlaG (beta-lactamase superfamily)